MYRGKLIVKDTEKGIEVGWGHWHWRGKGERQREYNKRRGILKPRPSHTLSGLLFMSHTASKNFSNLYYRTSWPRI